MTKYSPTFTLQKRIYIVCISVFFVLELLSVLFGWRLGIELFAPIAIFSVFLLQMENIKYMGPYKLSTFFMALGFLCLAIGDVLRFVNHNVIHAEPYTTLIRFIYVMPCFFYALNETSFFSYKLKGRRRDFSYVFVNSFFVATIGIAIIYKIYVSRVGQVDDFLHLAYLMFIFFAFYVCMMSLQTFYVVGWDQIRRGTLLTTVAMFLYGIMDIEYLFVMAIGGNPDTDLGDMIYLVCVIVMTVGTTIQVEKKYKFEFRKRRYTTQTIRVHTILSVVGVLFILVLLRFRLLSGTETVYYITMLMAYNIMGYLLYAGEWNDRQNARLEEMVKEKTKELMDINQELASAKFAAEEASRAKSDFLANMSHEIRTPINTILGMDEMLIREEKDPTLRKYAINIQRAGKMLLAQINDVLDFSKIEAGKMELYPDEYNLTNGLVDIYTMISGRADEKGLTFYLKVDPNMPHYLYGDNLRIRQVVMNLLTNAIKYTKEGSVTLSLSAEKIDIDKVKNRVVVEDTGIGIRKEDISRLFSVFERLDEMQNRTIEGTGLGMNIVFSLLRMMDSKLEVESTYGEGSRFSFEIVQKVLDWEPIGDIQEILDSKVEKSVNYHAAFIAPEAKVLLVDDTEMNLMVTKGLLKGTQVVIDTASNGKEALTMTEKKEYDVLLIDHRMPIMDGVEMIRRLRDDIKNPNRMKPAVALTANAVSGSRERYLVAGFDDYLIKPVNGELLEDMLQRYIPEEKLHFGSEDDGALDEHELLPVLEKIEESGYLDVKEGIEYAGSQEMYVDVLRFFLNTIDDKSDEIRRYYDEENWEDYQTKVHALKSSARVIGADELSNRAKSLELAAKEGNLDYIREYNGDLLTFFGSYKNKIRLEENEGSITNFM